MPSTTPDASVAPRRTHVHPGQVARAFRSDVGAFLARFVEVDGDTVVAVPVPDGPHTTFTVALPEAFVATLARDDITRLDGHPLALVSPRFGVLGLATGPAEPPDRLELVFVARLEGGHAVEIPPSGDGQPAFQLFATAAGEPGPGGGAER